MAEAVFDGKRGKVIPTPREPNPAVIDSVPNRAEIDWGVPFKKEAKAR